MNHDGACPCGDCARAAAYLRGARITMPDDETLERLARELAPDYLDPLEALHAELGDALFELPDDAAERLLWWRATVCWVWC